MFSLCVDLLALTDNVDHNRACKNAAGKDIRPVVGQADHIDDVVDDKHNENTQAYADRVADTAGQARAADHAGRDSLELPVSARRRLCAVNIDRRHHTGSRSQNAGDQISGNLDPLHIHTLKL